MIRKYFLAQAGVLALVVSLVDVVQAYDKVHTFHNIISLSGGGSFNGSIMRMRYTRNGNRIRANVQVIVGDANCCPLAAGVMAGNMLYDITPTYTGRVVGGEQAIDGVNYVCYVDARSIGLWKQASGDDRWYHSGEVSPTVECNYYLE